MTRIWFLPLLLFLAACASTNPFDLGEYDVFIAKNDQDPKKNSAEVNYQLAEAYRKSNRIQESTQYYAAAMKGDVTEEDLPLRYAQALRASGEPDRAKTVLTEYLTEAADESLTKQAERELKNLNKLDEVRKISSYYEVKNLKELNTPSAEYSPAYNRNYLYFTSNRDQSKVYKATGTGFTDLYRVGTKGAKVNLSTLKILPSTLNDPSINEGSMSLSPDGNWVVFAKGNSGKASGTEHVNLYFSRFRNGQWTEPTPLGINDPNAWDSSPALSPDGKTLYFSSNREGGYGGDDLYAANLNRRGRWVDVRNLGPDINTSGNESFPYVSEGGQLYFASDGHPGFGLLDLFVANRTGGKISVENLGQPMNSPADDFAFFQYNLTRGFFSSNRKGGMGDDDIYTFLNNDPDLKVVNYFLTGTTVTRDDGGGKITLPHTKVRLLDANDQVVEEVFTGEDGQFKFRVYTEETYNIVGEKTDYFTTRKAFSTIGKTVDKAALTEFITNVDFETEVEMDRIVIEKPIVLNNIYYDLDKAEIRADAAKVLDSLTLIMNDNPEIFIELGSHTDARDTDEYNLDLSRRRAISAVKYIISKGIDDSRVAARGYGESRLLIKSAQTEEEHQKNRRTEFKVLKYNPKDREESTPTEDEVDEYDRFFIDDSGQ